MHGFPLCEGSEDLPQVRLLYTCVAILQASEAARPGQMPFLWKYECMDPFPNNIKRELARLASFTEFNPRPVIEIDFSGKILDANASANTLFPELKKKGVKHPYLFDFANIVAELKKEGKPATRELLIKGRWFRQVFYFIPNFNAVHVYGSDITLRKQTEDELKKSELRYRSLFNKMSEGYSLKEAILDKNGRMVDYRFLDVNPAYENIVGLARVNLIGQRAKRLVHKSDPSLIKRYAEVMAINYPARFERYHEATGKYYEVFAYKTTGLQFAVLYLDITHLKKIEKEKDNFISIMSHELRNPLTPIMANIQFVQQLLAGKGDITSINESIDIVARQAKNMAELLDDILDISRLSHQKIPLHLRHMDISQIIKHAAESAMPLINTRKQKLSVAFGKGPLHANVDPLRFEQIVVNLVNNASKYTHMRGRIAVACQAKGGKIIISVKDNGIGMDARKIDKIFELFNRASKPVMGIGGLGIGLNLVKTLAVMHKGSIEAKSAGKNKGSEFIITIPRAKSPKRRVSRQSSPEIERFRHRLKHSGSAEKTTILVVDDNDDIKNTLVRVLAHAGHTVKTAGNGRSAVDIAKAWRPDIAIIDIGLPIMNGYKVAEKIRDKNILLIALTGYGQEKDKLLAKKAGFHHHLTKPVDIARLFEVINKRG